MSVLRPGFSRDSLPSRVDYFLISWDGVVAVNPFSDGRQNRMNSSHYAALIGKAST
jgi:hypothetical protein